LTSYEGRLTSRGLGPQTTKWTEVYDKTNDFENEELLLRNTYLNAQMGPFADFSATANNAKETKVRWVDTLPNTSSITLATVIGYAIACEPEVEQNNIESKDNLIPKVGSRNDKIIMESASAAIKDSQPELTPQLSARNSKDDSNIVVISEKKQSQNFVMGNQSQKKEIVYKPEGKKPAQICPVAQPSGDVEIKITKKAVQSKPEPAKRPNIDLLGGPIQIKAGKSLQKLIASKNTPVPNCQATLEALLRPKVNNYTTSDKDNKKIIEGKPIANIINQNNINNIIIQNPQNVEVIEVTTAKPESLLGLPISSSVVQQPQELSMVKKIVTAKKANPPARCSSAAIRRESPKPRLIDQNNKIKADQQNTRETQKDPTHFRDKK